MWQRGSVLYFRQITVGSDISEQDRIRAELTNRLVLPICRAIACRVCMGIGRFSVIISDDNKWPAQHGSENGFTTCPSHNWDSVVSTLGRAITSLEGV